MQMVRQGRSFSGFERHTVFLNCGQGPFANVSAVTGLDFLDDGRAISVVDWDHDGDLDLWLVNRTGPRIRLMLNQIHEPGGLAATDYVALKLRGRSCNRDAIGARVHVHLGAGHARSIVGDRVPASPMQSVRAGEGFLSQSSKWLHFGLGPDAQIDQVVVHWPSGPTEVFSEIQPGGRYLLVQGSGRGVAWQRPTGTLRLESSEQPSSPATQTSRVLLPVALPAPALHYTSLEDTALRRISTHSRPLLVNFWASWCLPCVTELEQFSARKGELDTAGMDLLALSVDGLEQEPQTQVQDARKLLDRMQLGIPSGRATSELLDKIEILEQFYFDQHAPFGVPMSLLLDAQGQIAAIYRGPVGVDRLLEDVAILKDPPSRRLEAGLDFSGRTYNRPDRVHLQKMIATHFLESYVEDAVAYFTAAVRDLAIRRTEAPSGKVRTELDEKLFRDHNELGLILSSLGRFNDAIVQMRAALAIFPESVTTRINLGSSLASLGRFEEAIGCYQRVLELDSNHTEVRKNLAKALLIIGQDEAALGQFQLMLRAQPESPPALNNVAWMLATHHSADIRDPEQAVDLAERATRLAGRPDASILDTLAAAYAAANRYEQAVAVASQALELAQTAGAESQVKSLQQRLHLYQQTTPYRQPLRRRKNPEGSGHSD